MLLNLNWSPIITNSITALGLLISVWQFQYLQRLNETQEFNRKIWEKTLEAYMEIGNVTGQIIASKPNTKEFNKLNKRFYQLYWGKLPLFEDDSVENEMKIFSDELQSFQRYEGDQVALKTKALKLMHVCKRSIMQSRENLNTKDRPNSLVNYLKIFFK